MAEADQRHKVVLMLGSLHAIAVENPALPGTPDVNYVEGWIELKWRREWPKRATSPVVFDHFSPQQRLWHIQRRRRGGTSWVLIQCRREWILLDGADAALRLNFMTRAELYDASVAVWEKGLDREGLIACISSKQKSFSLDVDDWASLKARLPD